MATGGDFTQTEGDVTVRVEGLSKTVRAASKAGADSTDMKELMHSIGMLVVRAATPPVVTGKLSGTVRAGRGKTKAVIRAGGAKAPYAGVIEYGWPKRGIAARHYLNEALNRERGNALEALNEGLDEILKKANLL